MSSFLQTEIDFDTHNSDVRELLAAFDRGEARRAPCLVIGSISNYFLNPDLNTRKLEFKQYFKDVDTQIRAQLEFQRWQRFHVLCDREMGVPEAGWQLGTDFQNSWEASWFGCPVVYHPGLIPDTLPVLAEDPYRLLSLPEPDPLQGGLVGRAVEFYDQMIDRCASLEFLGAPVLPPQAISGQNTDGPFTAALKVRGQGLMLDALTEPGYFHDLMDFVTSAIIRRMKALREYRWGKDPDAWDFGRYRVDGFCLADDAVAMLSARQYEELVFPYHRRIAGEFAAPGGLYMHLCGDATHLFPFMTAHLGVRGFDTGFPVDHGRLRRELGPNIVINGGPTVMLLKDGSPEMIEGEVRRISRSGALAGGRFRFIAANNLAPCTPAENIACFYDAVKRWAVFN